MIDIGWVFTNRKSFLQFATVLNRIGRVDLYLTDFVKIMISVYWSENKWLIFWRIFIPYCLYLALSLFYWINVICQT